MQSNCLLVLCNHLWGHYGPCQRQWNSDAFLIGTALNILPPHAPSISIALHTLAKTWSHRTDLCVLRPACYKHPTFMLPLCRWLWRMRGCYRCCTLQWNSIWTIQILCCVPFMPCSILCHVWQLALCPHWPPASCLCYGRFW